MRSLTWFRYLEQSTSHQGFAIAFALLRILLGVQFFWAGVEKFGGWSAAGYLSHASGPFGDAFASLAGSGVVDQLNIWGLTLIGLGLILGLLVRPASFFGIVLMMLYYLSGFEENTAHGLIDAHIISIAVLLMFLAGGAGHVFGVDGVLYKQVRRVTLPVKLFFG